MEKETKKCPYCGEEILISAKKCKHCGEWLTDKPINSQSYNKVVQKESCFNPNYLYDKRWMKYLFWMTIIGIAISNIYSEDSTVHNKYLEIFGTIIGGTGEICFLYLLMKAMSYMSKPLNIYFVLSISLDIFVSIFYIFFILLWEIVNENIYVILFCIVIASYVIIALLGIQFMLNYEGIIKRTGLIIVIYYCTSLIWMIVEDYCAFPIAFWVSLTIDILYYRYLRNLLTRNNE